MRGTFKEEMAKLGEMSLTEKLQHVWEYYKLQIGGILLASIFVGSMINAWFINPPPRTYLYVAIQGFFVNPQNVDHMQERLNEIVPDGSNHQVWVNSYALIHEDPEMLMAVQARFAALISSGELDLFIMNREAFYSNANGGLLRPAYDFVGPMAETDINLYNELRSRFVSITFTPDEGHPPITDYMAISLQGSPLLEAAGLRSYGLYLGMVVNSYSFYEVSKALQVFFN